MTGAELLLAVCQAATVPVVARCSSEVWGEVQALLAYARVAQAQGRPISPACADLYVAGDDALGRPTICLVSLVVDDSTTYDDRGWHVESLDGSRSRWHDRRREAGR